MSQDTQHLAAATAQGDIPTAGQVTAGNTPATPAHSQSPPLTWPAVSSPGDDGDDDEWMGLSSPGRKAGGAGRPGLLGKLSHGGGGPTEDPGAAKSPAAQDTPVCGVLGRRVEVTSGLGGFAGAKNSWGRGTALQPEPCWSLSASRCLSVGLSLISPSPLRWPRLSPWPD